MTGFEDALAVILAGVHTLPGAGERINPFASLEANRRDLEEITRARHLADLGAFGHVTFGLYVQGFGEMETGSLCDVAVIPSSVVFLDADASAPPGAEIGRAPREGLTLEATEFRSTVLAQDFADAPWTVRSMQGPGAVDLRGRVTVRWPAGEASFAFATPEGALEAVEAVRRHLSKTPGL
jgi:hypothetical protein